MGHLCPHLVRPVSFLIPLTHRIWQRIYYGAGVLVYDMLASIGRDNPLPLHRHLTKSSALELVPGFATASRRSFSIFARLNGVNDMYADEMALANEQLWITPSTWNILQTNPPELADEDGNIFHRFEGRPALQFRWRFPHEVYTTARSANGILRDISETNPLS